MTTPLATKKKPPLSVRLPPDLLERLDHAVAGDPDCVNRNQAIVAAVTTHVAKMERNNRRRARLPEQPSEDRPDWRSARGAVQLDRPSEEIIREGRGADQPTEVAGDRQP